MGAHWQKLGYASPWDMAWSVRESEAGHYETLARFVTANGLTDELRAISADPVTCRPFARAYTGPGFRKFEYDTKLAAAMR